MPLRPGRARPVGRRGRGGFAHGAQYDLAADGRTNSARRTAIASLVIDGDRTFDVIVSAQAMPGLPGVSVLTGLRSRGRRTPFVLMTGHPLVQAQARRLGAVVLDRPFEATAIRRVIEQAEALVTDRG